MPGPKLITDERMLKLKDWAIDNVEGINNETAFFTAINFPPTNRNNVKTGKISFTIDQIKQACILTGASADYIFGFTNIRERKTERNKLPIDLLKDAVAAVDIELKKNNGVTKKVTTGKKIKRGRVSL